MNKRDHHILSIVFLAVFVITVSLVKGCVDPVSQTSELSLNNGKNDSIQKWINSSSNIKLPIDKRVAFLDRSYQLSKKIKNDSIRVGYLSKLSLAAANLKDSLKFRKINKETIELAQLIQKKNVEAEANWDLAFFFKQNAIQDSAYYHYAKAYDIYTELKNIKNAGRVLLNIAKVQKDVKDFVGSESNAIKATEVLKPLDEYDLLYECYNHLGIVSMGLKEYDVAIRNYNKASEYSQKTKKNRYSSIQNNIGVVYQEQGKHYEAMEIFKKILETKELFETNPKFYAITLDNYAFNKFKTGNTKNVEKDLLKGLKLMDSLNYISGVVGSYYSLAEYYLQKKDSSKSLSAALKSKDYAEKSTNNYRLLQVLGLLVRLEPEKAVNHTQTYIKLNDSLQLEERKIRNKFARIRFETNETLEQNKLLARQKQLWVGIAATLLLLAFSAFMIIDQRVKNQKVRFQREQQESNEKIFTLLLAQKQKVEEGKKIAQKRISEELHDGVQGRIQGVRMLLLGLNKRTTPEAIEERGEAIKELMDIQEEVRVISHELSHAAYQKIHNFIQSIEELLLGVKNSAALEYAFEYDDEVDWDGLSSDVKVNLYRMVQESLQNCVKHAKASKVSLKFAVENRNNLKVALVDDGKGFVVKKGKKGIGLRNITSRIEKIGGTWDIESSPGKGTKVYFNIPIQSLAQPETAYQETALQEV